MSSILRLRILGIRAFDNREPQDLEFSSPLTLICGPNGVGKTTVIECLRYVATGDLPPNAKGGAFVHDPRMSSESEVKAQVKLLYKNAAGQRMVAARSMKLSVTGKGSYSFKTLEGYIKVQDSTRGETGSVGSRCADLNVQIPLSLGIPPAILNYVVFCHQEDSLWPLAEPSVVKKRFDEIFEATKYTKALESLKVIRKDYVGNIRVEKVEVEHLRVDRERVKEKQSLIAQLSDKVRELQEDCELLQKQRQVKSQELNNTVERSQRIQQLSYEVKDVARQRDRISQNIDLLVDQVSEVLDEAKLNAVAAELQNSEQREKQLEEEIKALRNQRTRVQNQADQHQQKLAVLANQQGRVEQLQETHRLQLAQRSELVERGDFEIWRRTKESELVKFNSELENMDVEHRQEEEVISRKINALEAERLQLRQSTNSLASTIRSLDEQIRKLNQQAAALRDSEAGLNSDEALQTMRERLRITQEEKSEAVEHQAQFESTQLVQNALESVADLEKKAETSRADLQQAIDASSALARLTFLRDSHRELESKLDNYETKIGEILKDEEVVPAAQDDVDVAAYARKVLEELAEAHERETRSLQNLEREVDTTSNAVARGKSKIVNTNAALSKALERLSGDEKLANNYDYEVQEAEEALLAATEEQEQLQFAHKFFSRALASAQKSEHPVCLLCEHEKTPVEAEKLAAQLLAKIDALSITPEEAEAETRTKRELLEGLRSKKPIVDKYLSARRELAASEEELQAAETRLQTLSSDADEIRSSCESSERRLNHLNLRISPLLQQFSRGREEIGELQRKLELESSMVQGSSAHLSPQEAQMQLEAAERDLKYARSELERAKSEQSRLASRVSNLDRVAQELKLRLSEFELKNARLKQVEQQISTVADNEKQTQAELKKAEANVPVVESKVSELQGELKQIKYGHAQLERELAEKRSVVVLDLQKLDELSRNIQEFEATYGNDPLEKLREEAAEINSLLGQLSVQLSGLNERLSEVEKQKIDFGSYVRNYKDNVRFRKMQAELAAVEKEFDAATKRLEQAQNEMGQDYEQQIKHLQEAVGVLNHRISTKTGESKAVQEQMQQIRHELATTYHETAEQYRRAVAKLQTSEGAVEDLVKYVKALDAAIMQYHTLKMAEINALLDEMWKRTYTGTDIDTIMISSESDAGSASTRASYNYRVCMVKQDTELDMRGRCSAGQKVLASILIRLALAECFGSSSGLIVLDEPTTNLDRENVEALAQSLSDIIATRRAQQNFQLIVITHDEHFLALMDPSSYCSYYYRIERDARQLSKVRKMPVASLS